MTNRSKRSSRGQTSRRSFGTKALSTAAIFCVGLTASAAVFMAAPTPSVAQQRYADQFNTPILDKANGSYYEVVAFGPPFQLPWEDAKMEADARVYKGRQGRLGVVKDAETHEFIAKHFAAQVDAYIWIGLTYHCDSRQLIWEDGTLFKPGEFSAWGSRWYRNQPMECIAERPYMPVAYMPATRGFVWQATGPAKFFEYYLVEYPAPPKTGKNDKAVPASKSASASQTAAAQ
jgi:hypothetical protein